MKRRKQQKSQATKVPASGAYPPLPFAELPQHNSYALLFLINVIVGLVWQQIFPIFGSVDYLVGFVIGFFAIWFSNRTYGRRAYDLAYFIGFILWEILLSNFMLAKLVIQPKPKLDPGIVAVPLTVSTMVVCSQSGAPFGTRFWKNDLPDAPSGNRCIRTGRPPIQRINGSATAS